MSDKDCSVTECDRAAARRGYCFMHYQRFMKHGDPLVTAYASSAEDAFSRYTETAAGGCVVWTASKGTDGYGKLKLKGKTYRAHRLAWEMAHGPIPEGMQVDHTCWNVACVNIDHLRLASTAENQHYRNGSHRDSKTGFRNVYDRGTHFQVMIGHNGKQRHYGTFATIEEAVDAAELKRAELFGAFAGRG